VVWRAMQEHLITLHKEYTGLIDRCYPQSGIAVDFSINDILSVTTDIAASAGK